MVIRSIQFLLLTIIAFSSSTLFGQAKKSDDVLIMKDGSVIKGEIIFQDEYSLKIIDLRGDTLDYSFKYIDQIRSSDEVGSRVSERTNLGVQISLPVVQRFGSISDLSTRIVGISGYSKYFLDLNKNGPRFFVDGWLGIIVDGEAFDNENTIKPYAGLNLGIQLATKKKVRFFWRPGIYAYQQVFDDFSTERSTEVLPSITFVGIEF